MFRYLKVLSSCIIGIDLSSPIHRGGTLWALIFFLSQRMSSRHFVAVFGIHNLCFVMRSHLWYCISTCYASLFCGKWSHWFGMKIDAIIWAVVCRKVRFSSHVGHSQVWNVWESDWISSTWWIYAMWKTNIVLLVTISVLLALLPCELLLIELLNCGMISDYMYGWWASWDYCCLLKFVLLWSWNMVI